MTWNEETQTLLQAVLKRRRSPKGRRHVNHKLTNALAAALGEIERLKVQYNGCNEERISAQNRADAHWDKLYQAEQRIKELEGALRKAEHSRACKRQTMFDPPELCDCGIHAALSSEGEGNPKLPEAWKCKACGYQTAEDPCGNCGAKKGTVFRRHPERVFGEGEEE